MNLTDFNNILEQSNFPVAHSHFKKPQVPPYICYLVEGNDNFKADNKVYHKLTDIRVELYTEKKTQSVENVLESLFEQYEIPWDSNSEGFIKSENIYLKIYDVRLI